MKILTNEQIREADAYTIKNEPITSLNLMERAAGRCFLWLEKNMKPEHRIMIFCGTGNNGGDGLAIARMIKHNERERDVSVFIAGDPVNGSEDFKVNLERLKGLDIIVEILSEKNIPIIHPFMDIVVDAIFGSGLSSPTEGIHANIIDHLNSSGAIIVSIDIPSGLYADQSVKDIKGSVIMADYTLTFSPPKIAFFFPGNDNYAGRWELIDIGLSQVYLEKVISKSFYTTPWEVAEILRPRRKYSHKGDYGHSLLVCGSRGKMGAAVLAARACLRSGAGLVTVHVPSGGISILQIAAPEAMVNPDNDENIFSQVPDLTPYKAIAVGSGIGTSEQTAKALKFLIQNSKVPLVLDADALNILGENKTWLSFLPMDTILTPHPKEFERIAGKTTDDFERNERQRELSLKHGIYIILKGAHTAITTPEGKCYFNSTGNPGMATGGSGDVLTGILAGLMAQGYTSAESCLTAVCVHGLAGDIAATRHGFEAMTSGDIINELGSAFQLLHKSREKKYGIKIDNEDDSE